MKIRQTQDLLTTEGCKILVYGDPGVGKTHSAMNLKKALCLDTENGFATVSSSKMDYVNLTKDDDDKILPYLDRAKKVSEFYKFANSDEARQKYDTIFFDGLTEFGEIIKEIESANFPEPKDSLRMWGEVGKKQKKTIRAFRDLPGYNVIFTSLSTVERDEQNRRYLAFDVPGSLKRSLAQFFDIVLYLHVFEDDDGNIVRQFVTSSTDRIIAKDRTNKLDLYEPPDLQHILDKIKGGKKK